MAHAWEPRPPGRPPLLGDSPADRIYEAALACVDDAGFRRTSMDDIARRAGVSRPTIYTYFRSKRDVVLEVLVRQAELLLVEMAERTAGLVGLDRILAAADFGVRAARANPYYRSFIADGQGAAWTTAALRHDRFRELEQHHWAPLVADAVARGEVRADPPAAELIDWIVFQQFAIATHAEALAWDDDHVAVRIQTFLRPALSAPATPAPASPGTP